MFEKDGAAGFDGHQVGLAAFAGGDGPLQLGLRRLHGPFAEYDVHLDLALVPVVGPRYDLHVVEELQEEDVAERGFGIFDVVQLSNLEVVLALDDPWVGPAPRDGLHLVVEEDRLDAGDLSLDDVRHDVARLHAVKVRDGAEREPLAGVVPLDDVLHRGEDADGALALPAHGRQHLAFDRGGQRGGALHLERLDVGPDLLAKDELDRVPVFTLGRHVGVDVGEQAGVEERLEIRGEVILAHLVALARVEASEELSLGGNAGAGGKVGGEHGLDDEVAILEHAARGDVVVVVVVIVIVIVVVVIVVLVIIVVVVLVIVVLVVLVVVGGVGGGDAPAVAAGPAVSAVSSSARAVAAVAREGHLEDVHGLGHERGGHAGDGERHGLSGREREATEGGTVGGCDETLLGGVGAIRRHDDDGALLGRGLPHGKRRHGLCAH